MEPALKQWFLHSGRQRTGPFGEEEVRRMLLSKEVSPDFLVWSEGMTDWKKIIEVDAFRVKQPTQAAPPRPQEDLSALIDLSERAKEKKEEATVFVDLRTIKKVRNEAVRAEAAGKESPNWRLRILLLAMALALLFLFVTNMSRAQADESPAGEKLSVEGLKHKYWAEGEEDELRVVQNRRYSKTHKLEIALMGGFVSNDPFLSVHAFGGSLGYYLSENVEMGLVGWKYQTSNSSALNTLQQTKNTTANTNPPAYFLGADLKWTPLYGKLSVLGEAIIYYDIYLLGGGGVTNTTTGTDLTPTLGIGSQIYLSQAVLLQLTFYQQMYSETVPNSVTGVAATTRTNWSSAVMLGFNFLVF